MLLYAIVYYYYYYYYVFYQLCGMRRNLTNHIFVYSVFLNVKLMMSRRRTAPYKVNNNGYNKQPKNLLLHII